MKKVIYEHIITKEIIEDELPSDFHWTQIQYYHKFIQLDIESSNDLRDSEWRLIRHINEVLEFEFITDEYVW